ncbi:MAG: tRNA pseudouridine(38-40) synthase TruA [Niabella sp.]
MRYFLEVSYKGTRYSGFQVQQNARTIQGEIEKSFQIFFKEIPSFQGRPGRGFTGSSRTDAGVHALQNFFHFDWPEAFQQKWIYNLNAILPDDIVIISVKQMDNNAHCRFDAISRTYHYHVYQYKNPFLSDRAYYYPYTLDFDKLNQAAAIIKVYTDFTSFSKRNTQVKTFDCSILQSEWLRHNDQLIYRVTANRFLRGMVRALTATMLKVGRQTISISQFEQIIKSRDCTKAFFDTPAHGLILMSVSYTG